MTSLSSSAVRSAIERAESRASVSNSLQKTYGDNKSSKATTQSAPAVSGRISTGGGERHIQSVLNFVCDHREKTRKALHDSLLGKSIVLTNLTSQIEASKSAKRTKSALGRLTSQRGSKSKLKRLHLCDPMTPPLADDLQVLNKLWRMYISTVLRGAQSEAQIQARLITAEMVGAQVVVVKSGTEKCNGPHRELRGTISSISENCFYIASEKMVVSSAVPRNEPGPGPAGIGNLDNTIRLRTLISTYSTMSSTTSSTEQKCRHMVETNSIMVADNLPTAIPESCSTAVGLESTEVHTEPSAMSINTVKKGKVLTWSKAVVVQRVLKATCVLAVFLPRPHSDSGKDIGAAGDQDKICLLHGSQHMLFATRTLS